MTTDPREIRDEVVCFYSNLFKAEDVDMQKAEMLQRSLPKISEEEKVELDSVISMQELTEAVGQMSSGRAPGINGLNADFYKKLWGCIGPDFYEVVMESLKNGVLQQSCRRAVLTLLPKKGDQLHF